MRPHPSSLNVNSPSVKRRGAVLIAAALLASAIAVPASTALTAQPAAAATDYGWWYSSMGVAEAHAAGWTGAGVKIAVIDTQINPDAPAIAGANVTVDDQFMCEGEDGITTETTDGALHGVGMVELLTRPFGLDGQTGGIAPDADIHFFAIGNCSMSDMADGGRTPLGKAIIAAVDAGNRVISISRGASASPGGVEAITYALAKGAVVVSSSPNDLEQMGLDFPVGVNGVVSVAAISSSMDLITDPDAGTTIVTEEIAVVAPGIGIGVVGKAGDWAAPSAANGSSNSAVLTAGALVLAAQKFPTASGNQLVQALIHSTASAQQGVGRDTEFGYGYGLVSLSGLLASDPLSYPDENPLMDKVSGEPSVEDVEAAAGGGLPSPSSSPSPSPSREPSDDSSPAPSESETSESENSGSSKDDPGGVASGGDDSSSATPWLVGAGAAVLVGVGLIVFVIVRSRRQPHVTQGGNRV